MGFLSLLCHLCFLPSEGKMWQYVHHDLGKAVSQQLLPVLTKMMANRPHLIKVIQKDQVWDQDVVGRPESDL